MKLICMFNVEVYYYT